MTKFTKKALPGIILMVLGALLAAGLVVKIDTRELITALLGFPFLGFLLILLFTFLGIVVANWRMYVILKPQHPDIKFMKLLGVWLVGNALNYLTPVGYLGGEGVKAYLLNNRFGLSWDRTASALIFDRILEITVSLLMIAVSLVVFIVYAGPAGLTKTILSVVISIGTLGILTFFFYAHVLQNKKVVTPLIKRFSLENRRAGIFIIKSEQELIDFFVGNRRIFWQGWGISVLRQFVLLGRHILLLYFLGKGVTFVASIVSLGALYVGFAVPIPASLGVQEAFQSAAFTGLGFKAGEGLALSFVLRGADILVSAVGILILLRYGLGLMTTGIRGLMDKGLEEGGLEEESNMLELNGENK